MLKHHTGQLVPIVLGVVNVVAHTTLSWTLPLAAIWLEGRIILLDTSLITSPEWISEHLARIRNMKGN